MDRMSVALFLGLVATGCGPLIPVDETGDGSTTFEGPNGDGPNPSVPPNNTPTTPDTTTPDTTTPVTTTPPPPVTTTSPTECAPGEEMSCPCPDGSSGSQICSAAGVYGECVCEPWETSDSFGTSGSSGGWQGSGSSGDVDPTGGIPDLPPGETCLPLDMPCVGSFQTQGDAELEAFAACSRIQGELEIEGGASSLAPLGCLREVEGLLVIGNTSVEDLSEVGALEFVEVLALFANGQLVSASLPTLELVDGLFVINNDQLDSVDFPNLLEINEHLEVNGNPQLPDCAIAALVDQTSPPDYYCENNLADMCSGLCN